MKVSRQMHLERDGAAACAVGTGFHRGSTFIQTTPIPEAVSCRKCIAIIVRAVGDGEPT